MGMSNYVGDNVRIDHDRHRLTFSADRMKKITGTRLASIVNRNAYCSEFEVACDICKLFKEDVDNKYLRAGRVIEPLIRRFVREHEGTMSSLGTGLKVEDPVDSETCYYDHFGKKSPYYRKGLVNTEYIEFGGLVDGYVDATNGERLAVLEIKTAGIDKKGMWFTDGEFTVPEHYVLQASLYCKLTSPELRKIVFAVGFLEESDYAEPGIWSPNENNTHVAVVDVHPEIEVIMFDAREWYMNLKTRTRNGRVIIEWDPNNPRDLEVVRMIEEQVRTETRGFEKKGTEVQPPTMSGFTTADNWRSEHGDQPSKASGKPFQSKLF